MLLIQIGAFKDFEAGTSSSNNDSGAADTSKEAASAAQQDEGEEEEEEEEEVTESSGGSSGDYPPHTLAGMPALSPTMEQGNNVLPLWYIFTHRAMY